MRKRFSTGGIPRSKTIKIRSDSSVGSVEDARQQNNFEIENLKQKLANVSSQLGKAEYLEKLVVDDIRALRKGSQQAIVELEIKLLWVQTICLLFATISSSIVFLHTMAWSHSSSAVLFLFDIGLILLFYVFNSGSTFEHLIPPSSLEGKNIMKHDVETTEGIVSEVGELEMTSTTWINFFEGIDSLDFYSSDCAKVLSKEEMILFTGMHKEMSTAKNDQIPWVEPNEFTTLKFLQADNFDVKVASARYRKTVSWYFKFDVPSLVLHPPSALHLYRELRVRRFMGMDKFNRPIHVERLGEYLSLVGSGHSKSISREDHLKCVIHEIGEYIKKFRITAQQQGIANWKNVYIMDVQNVKFMSVLRAVSLIKYCVKATEDNFPEMAGPIVMINAPPVAEKCWLLVKPFLDKSLIEKFKFFQGVPYDYLLTLMDKSVLFEEYGGTNKTDFPHAITYRSKDD